MNATQIEDLTADLLWAIDHGIASTAQVALAKFLDLDIDGALADFPHYSS